ncbi:uncharacterized protein LOC113391896 [Vanessa tameamea]|uniref:Uncharacterized protein LOC113391896 n=1 Tax=Vanessa tameamea TaxID=334116 RepID=A0A8B8HH07_VANTA|nr:uncharacterized protein LOC113391896 [Vanessa tameamea]
MSASTVSRGTPARVNGTDIIDLDRYMRATVRPSRHRPQHTRERLIVDAGGINRIPVDVSSSTDSSPLQSHTHTRDHCKQYSHDSGLSDGSYLRQRHRPQRRVSVEKSRESSRVAGSNSSVREFKAACEKALREQQQQIARVAELCEKLVQPQIAQNILQTATPNVTNVGQNSPNTPRVTQTFNCMNQNTNQFGQYLNSDLNENTLCVKQNFGQNVSQIKRVNRDLSPCTSDITSSSCSTRNVKMRDKHRSDSCKTYNLIMGKLDELSQLFATRRVPVQTHLVRQSSESVSMCDKVVATDDGRGRNFDTVKVLHTSKLNGRVQPINQSLERRQLKTQYAMNVTTVGRGRNHVAGDGCLSDAGSVSDVFDLDNPLHLYSQAKRLQELRASSQRTSSSRPPHKRQNARDYESEALGDQVEGTRSVCALCREYWRIIRQYFNK